MADYYDGTKLLSLQDLNGRKPEIYMVTTNKTGGKTTYFSRLCVNRFLDSNSKFMLIYRFRNELDDCADKFFRDIRGLFFPSYEMTAEKKADGIYSEFFLNKKSCGYAVSLNSVDAIKKMSHFFSDTGRMFLDEFQSETNHYCPDEVTKFRALHKAVARGQGKQYRYVPVYMCSNPVSLLNPYFTAMNVTARLRKDTKFLKGTGWVLENGYVESADLAQRESGFNQAFGQDDYEAYQSQGVYLDDDRSFITKPEGKNKYLCTLRYEGRDFAVREYLEEGIVYCDNTADYTFPFKIAVTTDDHRINYVMLRKNDWFIQNLRYYFEHGAFRFKDLICKDAVLKAISYGY